jgi:predicted small lipoprotein YifL
MSHNRRSLIAFIFLAALTGCGQKPDATRSAAATQPAARPDAQNAVVAPPTVTPTTRPAQETAFIRECLAVGLRPTLLLELESKALAEAQGQVKAGGPTKAQLKDLRDSFSAAAAKLNEMAASPEAGRKAPLAKLLADTRAKQAANCSRLPDDLLHGEGVGRMMLEFINITAQAPNQQEADRRAGEHFRQNWPDLFNLPVQQKAALDEILKTEQDFQQVVIGLNNDPELKVIQQEAIAEVVRGLEARAKKIAAAMDAERHYGTLLGTVFPQRPWTIENGELVSLTITGQKIVGHCIVSKIRLAVRGRSSGQNASFDLSVVHRTYADGRPAVLQVIER